MRSELSGPILRQGLVVSFEIPKEHTVGLELNGRLLGAVISHDLCKSRMNGVLVVPFLRKPSSTNDKFGIPASPEGLDGWLRPDLTRTVGRNLCSPVRKRDSLDGRALSIPYSQIDTTIEKLLEIIRPSPHKMGGNRVPLGYGELSWFKALPYFDQPWIEERAPAVCLSPQAIYQETGVALVSRRFSNITKAHPRYDVVSLSQGFNPGYFTANGIHAVSLDRISLRSSERCKIGERALKGIEHKLAAFLTKTGFDEVVERYPDEKGVLPDFIQKMLLKPHHHSKFRVDSLSAR